MMAVSFSGSASRFFGGWNDDSVSKKKYRKEIKQTCHKDSENNAELFITSYQTITNLVIC